MSFVQKELLSLEKEHKILIDIVEDQGITRKPQKSIKSIYKVLTVPQKIEEKRTVMSKGPETKLNPKSEMKIEYDGHGAPIDNPSLQGLSRYFNSSTLRGRANVAKLTLGSIFAYIMYKQYGQPAKPEVNQEIVLVKQEVEALKKEVEALTAVDP